MVFAPLGPSQSHKMEHCNQPMSANPGCAETRFTSLDDLSCRPNTVSLIHRGSENVVKLKSYLNLDFQLI